MRRAQVPKVLHRQCRSTVTQALRWMDGAFARHLLRRARQLRGVEAGAGAGAAEAEVLQQPGEHRRELVAAGARARWVARLEAEPLVRRQAVLHLHMARGAREVSAAGRSAGRKEPRAVTGGTAGGCAAAAIARGRRRQRAGGRADRGRRGALLVAVEPPARRLVEDHADPVPALPNAAGMRLSRLRTAVA